MKNVFRGSAIFLLLVAALWAATESPRVSRSVLSAMERSLDTRINRLWDDNPLALIGSTRGVYLEGCGAVFSNEVNMVTEGVSLMNLNMTKDQKDRYHAKKLARLPQLKQAMKQALVDSAASLDPVPMDEQIAFSVVLSRYTWEDATGIPAQITFQASKRKLLDVKRANGAGMDAAIRVTEY